MPLYDAYGRIIEKPPAKPELEQIGAVRIRDQFSNYPSHGLTPTKLATILKEADNGDILRQAELFEEMEEKDPDLASLFQTRKLAVQGLELDITPASDSADDKRIADFVRENFEDLDLDDPTLDLLDAIAKGCAFVEINWDVQGSEYWVSSLEWIHQKRFTFADFSSQWNAPLPRAPRLLTDAEPIRGEDIPAFKMVYHRYKARSGFAPRSGIMRTVAFYYLFKNLDLKDWVIFLEKFGQPLRLGKYSPGASEDDKKVLRQAIRDLGADAGAIISDQTMLEILEAKTTSSSLDLYERAADFFNKSYAKAILGQTATTEGTPGKLGGEHERAEVRDDLKEADAKALAKTLRMQLVWPMVAFNFGWDKPLPQVHYIIEESEDLAQLSQTHKNLVEIGMPIPLSFIRKKYGIPEPEGDEPVLATPAQPQPPPFFAAAQKKSPLIPVGTKLLPS